MLALVGACRQRMRLALPSIGTGRGRFAAGRLPGLCRVIFWAALAASWSPLRCRVCWRWPTFVDSATRPIFCRVVAHSRSCFGPHIPLWDSVRRHLSTLIDSASCPFADEHIVASSHSGPCVFEFVLHSPLRGCVLALIDACRRCNPPLVPSGRVHFAAGRLGLGRHSFRSREVTCELSPLSRASVKHSSAQFFSRILT